MAKPKRDNNSLLPVSRAISMRFATEVRDVLICRFQKLSNCSDSCFEDRAEPSLKKDRGKN